MILICLDLQMIFFGSLFVISQLDQNNLSFNTRARPSESEIKQTAALHFSVEISHFLK